MSEEKNPAQEGQPTGIELEDLQQAVNADASPLFDFLTKYAKPIIYGVVAVVVVAAGWGGVKTWNSYSEGQAAEEMTQILTLSGQERIDALKAYAPTAPEAVKGGALFELAAGLMAAEQYEDAAATWKQIEDMGNPEMVTLAQMGRTRCLLLAGKADDALAQAKATLESAPEEMLAPVNRLLAACAEAADDKATAATALQALIDTGRAVDADLLTYRIEKLNAE